MQRYPFDEMTKVYWVPTIADISAPTVSELTAGVDITCFLTKDGLAPGGSTSKVDGGSLCSRVDGQSIGSVTYDATLKGYRDRESGGDDFWILCSWNAAGYLVIRRGTTYSTAFAAANKVEVYEASMGEPVMASSAKDTNQTFEVQLAVANADIKATVAA